MTKKKIFSSLVFPRPKVGIQSIRSGFELSESISIRHKIVDIIFEVRVELPRGSICSHYECHALNLNCRLVLIAR